MIVVLVVLVLLVAAFLLGRLVERALLLRDLDAARRDARAADQVALSEVMRALRGRAR